MDFQNQLAGEIPLKGLSVNGPYTRRTASGGTTPNSKTGIAYRFQDAALPNVKPQAQQAEQQALEEEDGRIQRVDVMVLNPVSGGQPAKGQREKPFVYVVDEPGQ
jgi:hypothetical protein